MSEIDELLNTLKTSSLEPHEEYTMQFTNREQKILLDYLTSLEKGLEYAKRIEKDYKTKFDKAIEYIDKMTDKEINNIEYKDKEFVICGSDFGEGAYIIKDILQGSEK